MMIMITMDQQGLMSWMLNVQQVCLQQKADIIFLFHLVVTRTLKELILKITVSNTERGGAVHQPSFRAVVFIRSMMLHKGQKVVNLYVNMLSALQCIQLRDRWNNISSPRAMLLAGLKVVDSPLRINTTATLQMQLLNMLLSILNLFVPHLCFHILLYWCLILKYTYYLLPYKSTLQHPTLSTVNTRFVPGLLTGGK